MSSTPENDPVLHPRYRRQRSLPEVGEEGQCRLQQASVLVVGAGGLGSPALLYLAAAGVGKIGIAEFDEVDVTNLHRQILYEEQDIGRSKLEAACDRLLALNPSIEIVPHAGRIEASNALSWIEPYDLVLDGSDNFGTRYLVNDACVLAHRPCIHGSVYRFEGQLSIFATDDGPCYRCLFPEPPADGSVMNCAEGGVLGVLPGIIGTLQATEAIKWLLGRGQSLVGRLLIVDALDLEFRELKLLRNPNCPVCGAQPTITTLSEPVIECATGAESRAKITARTLQTRLSGDSPPRLLDVRTRQEWEICHLPDATLIPLQELEPRLSELDPSAEWVVYCHVGMRSAVALDMLLERGFRNARHLAGGIESWSLTVDPAVRRY